MSLIKLTERPRIRALDSLRGFAALSVVLTHITAGDFYPAFIHLTPFYILQAGHEAVIFFFLLSGYVLVYQYEPSTNYTYFKFLVQRVFRIYVPYIVSITLCLVLCRLCIPRNIGPAWIRILWSHWIDYKVIIRHIILVGNFDTDAFNPVIWSLVHEMRMSLLFPLVLFIVRLKPRSALLVVFVIVITGSVALLLNILPGKGYYNSYSFTLFYLHVFILGGLIAKNQQVLINYYRKLKTYQKYLLLITALLVYNYANLLSLFFADTQFSAIVKERVPLLTSDVLVSLAAGIIVIAAVSLPGNNFLTKKVPLFLGKVSYSLYLVHLPVLGFIYFTLYRKMPLLLVLGIGFMLAFLIAIAFNKYIEQVSVRAAKRFLSRLISGG